MAATNFHRFKRNKNNCLKYVSKILIGKVTQKQINPCYEKPLQRLPLIPIQNIDHGSPSQQIDQKFCHNKFWILDYYFAEKANQPVFLLRIRSIISQFPSFLYALLRMDERKNCKLWPKHVSAREFINIVSQILLITIFLY